MKKKIFLSIFILAVTFALIFLVVFFLRREAEQEEKKWADNIEILEASEEKSEEPEIQNENSKEKSEEPEAQTENPEEKNEEDEQELPIKLEGVTEEHLEILGVTKYEIAEALRMWTSENGYVSASGAVFGSEIEIRLTESKYSVGFYLTFEESGNGVRPQEQTMLVMDFYKDKENFFFYE